MRFGLTLPIFDRVADPRLLAELAHEAEDAGWDAVFVWDHIAYRSPVRAATDPWIAMAAMATRTERVLLGPMVTPLARRRPHIVARQLVALDHLSDGRLVFGVGLGMDASGDEFARFGEETDPLRRAAMLDEGLGVLQGLLSGDEIDHRGEHYTAAGVRFLPTPVQPRLPIWVAGRWPNRRPLRRAARYDGAFIIDITPAELPAAIAEIEAAASDVEGAGGRGDLDLHRGFDVIVDAAAGADAAAWADAGATWLLTRFDQFTATAADVRAVIANRPTAQ